MKETLKTFICPSCGDMMLVFRNTRKLCPACAKKKYKREEAERRRRKIDDIEKDTRCPFCGNLHSGKIGLYCRICVLDGFDKVHQIYGITNGWNKKRVSSSIEPGWRGPMHYGVAIA